MEQNSGTPQPAEDQSAEAEQIALNARQIELAIGRLMLRLQAVEAMQHGLADCKAAFAALADRYAAEARASNGRSVAGWRTALATRNTLRVLAVRS